jgi:hypothetical protein
VSFDAIRWALDQPTPSALTKLLLVAMADCVNAEGAEVVCWPSYAFLARRTGMNTKTVEAGIYKLKQQCFIVDTGKRAGDTGKVVVYRLNDPNCGAITPGPQGNTASGTRPQTPPEPGPLQASAIPPNLDGNPPKFGGQSPQKVESIPPKTGSRSRNGTSNGTRKEPGIEALEISGVPPNLLADWKAVRKDKRAGPITETVIEALTREAEKAGITVSAAVRYCCEAGWQGFNAGFYAKREGGNSTPMKKPGKHAGFTQMDYREGVNADGSLV